MSQKIENWYKWISFILLSACAFFVMLGYYEQRATHDWMIQHSQEFKEIKATQNELWDEIKWINYYLATRDTRYYFVKYNKK